MVNKRIGEDTHVPDIGFESPRNFTSTLLAKAIGNIVGTLTRQCPDLSDMEIYAGKVLFTWGYDQTRFMISILSESNFMVEELVGDVTRATDKARLIASLIKEGR